MIFLLVEIVYEIISIYRKWIDYAMKMNSNYVIKYELIQPLFFIEALKGNLIKRLQH